MKKPDYVYVASSWHCALQPRVIQLLRAVEIDCYDFRDPEQSRAFRWSEVHLDTKDNHANTQQYLQALSHPRSVAGFQADYAAMQRADTFILVLPCGRSAHLELGWATGCGKRTAILLDGPIVIPELMYLLCDYITTSPFQLLDWLGVSASEWTNLGG